MVVTLASMMSPTVVTTTAIEKQIMSRKQFVSVNPKITNSQESKYEPSCKRWLEDHLQPSFSD